MKKPVVIGLAIAALIAVIAGGTWWYQSRQDDGLTLYGNVDIRTVNISFRVGGRLASLNVDEGDTIKAGQVLGELDHAPYENALMQAKAGVSVAQAQYDLMLAGYRDEEIAQAAAAVRQAQAAYDYAQNFYNRQQGLWKSRTISANDLENARSSRDQAQATLKSAQDKLSQYRTVIVNRISPRRKPAWNRQRPNWRRRSLICRTPRLSRLPTEPCSPARSSLAVC